MKDSIHKTIIKTSLASGGRFAIRLGVILFLTPFIIKHLGDSDYGLWAVIFAVIGYAGLFTMGVQHAIIKLVAQYKNTAHDKVNSIVSGALCLYTTVGCLTFLFCWLIAPDLMPKIINGIDYDREAFATLMFWVGINSILVFVKSVLLGSMLGFLLHHLNALIDMVIAVVRVVLTIVLLNAGMGILGLVYVQIGLSLLALLLALILSKRSIPWFEFGYSNVTISAMKEILGFGLQVFVAVCSGRLYKLSIPVVISSITSTVFTAYYAVASRLVSTIIEILTSFTASFLPIFSEVHENGTIEDVVELYIQYTKYYTILFMPCFISLILVGPDFIGVWISETYEEQARQLIVLLAIAGLIFSIQPLFERVMYGTGKLKFYVKLVSFTSVAELLLAAALMYLYGLIGVGVASIVAKVFLQIMQIRYMRIWPGVGIMHFFRGAYGSVLPSLVLFTIGLYFMKQWLGVNSYINFIIVVGVPYATHLLLAFFLSFKREDRVNFLKTIKVMK